MLTFPLMAALAAAILWINTLLIVAAAWQDFRVLAAARRRFAGGGVGTVTGGSGVGGVLASFEVEQIGRATDPAPPSVLFADRAFRSEVFGGTITTDDGRSVTLAPAAGEHAEVWTSGASLERARNDAEHANFDEAYAEARRPRGFVRTLSVNVREGDRVWFATDAGGPTAVSAVDPARLCAGHQRKVLAFMVGALLVAGACTAGVMSAPPTSVVARLGGAACLVFFLLVQPAGVGVRNAVRLPHRGLLAGRWKPAGTDARATA